MIHILLCEDEETHIQEFIKEFGGDPNTSETDIRCGNFVIEVCRHIDNLERRLKNKDKKLPDILIIDLYWPINEGDRDRSSFRSAIDGFNQSIDELRIQVPKHVKPRGWYYVIDDLRADLRLSNQDLPVLLYTKAGPYVLDPDILWKMEESETKFLLKKDHADLKKRKIKNMVEKFGFKNDVFISYSSHDVGVANEICEQLRNYNLRVFCAAGLPAGSSWNDEIRQNLIKSRVAALLISSHSLRSKWVDYEIGACWALQKTVIPGYMGISMSEVPEIVRHSWQCTCIDTNKNRQCYIEDIIRHCMPSHAT